MEEIRRNTRMENHWISASLSGKRINSDKDKGNGGGLGNGALQFIRSRGSIRRQGKRESSNRSKTSSEGHTTALDVEGSGNSGGGGFGKWLRDHLGGSSRGHNHEIVPSIPSKTQTNCNSSYDLSSRGSDKNLTRTTYTPQNLYCSLPREHHRRHFHIGTTSKSSYDVTREQSRLNGDATIFRERSGSNDFCSIARSDGIYGSEGKNLKKRERERRRHSMNETRAHSRQHRIRDRQAIIEKLRELKNEEPDLKRKNRLYQYWVSRVMNKKHQKMRPEDETLNFRCSENRYIKELFSYKISIDEIEARESEIKIEIANMENNLKTILDDDSETFCELLNRQREIGVGLKYEKSARILTVKAIEAMIRRQIIRRDLMNRDRFQYIFYRHRYEDIKSKIRRVETLGDGMTIMDYEIISHENYCYKEKLEEREKELEKLYNNIEAMLTRLANYKQLEASNIANINHEKNHLDLLKSKVLKTREEAFEALKTLLRTRRACETKKRRGGMLFALPVLHEMEKTLKDFETLKLEIDETLPEKKKSFNDVQRSLQTDGNFKVDENRKIVTRMTKVKRSSANSKKPGRC